MTVAEGSPAEGAGLQSGDDLLEMAGQPLLSTADIQWVLHTTDPDGAEVDVVYSRDGARRTTKLALEPGWRRLGDISWRVSAWGLRRMTTGGLKLSALNQEERAEAGIPEGEMALGVDHVGQYGAHAAAKRAGFEKGDVLLSFDGRDDLMTDSDILAYGVTHLMPGEEAEVEVLRNGRRLTLSLPMQE